jgi:hypothetical protein
MRRHFFRSFVADPVCASSDAGHHIDIGRYFMAVAKSAVTIGVNAHICDGLVHLDTDEILWHHRPDDIAHALQSTGGRAEWAPEWQVLLVPGAALADDRTVFTLADPDECTDCEAEVSLAQPCWRRRY